MRTTDELYGETYYRTYFGRGESIPYERNDHWLRFFGSVADSIVQRIRPETVLDAGCALGFLVEALRQRGVRAEGIDVSEYAISNAHESVREHVRVGSLTETIDGRFDLVTCIEVIEHVDPTEVDAVLRNITSVTDALLLSSTPMDFEEPTHLNVQPPEYWATRLAELGFHHDLEFDATFLTPWAALYRRADRSLSDLIRSYERERWQLVRERDALRASAQDQLASDADAPDTRAAGHALGDDLRDQLRDAVDAARGADARRATVEARLAHVEYALAAAEAREEEVAGYVHQISELCDGDIRRLEALLDARTYRAYWRLLAPYRWLRDRTR